MEEYENKVGQNVKYAIDKKYKFPDNDGIVTSVHVCLDHLQAMEFAERFLDDEEYTEVDGWIKDMVDDAYAEDLAESLCRRWNEENDEQRDIESFYDEAWFTLEDTVLYYEWPQEFKDDCIRYHDSSKDA